MQYVLLIIAIVVIVKYGPKIKQKRTARIEAEKKAEMEKQEQERIQREKEELERQRNIRRAQEEEIIQKAILNCPGSEIYRKTYVPNQEISFLTVRAFTPISKKRFVAFDLETTGLTAGLDGIIEIGAARVENGVITETFQQLINPGYSVPIEATEVNNINDYMLINQPKIYEVLPAFLKFIGDDVLAAHNAKFDEGFLSYACTLYRFKKPERYFDTMNLARYWPDARNKKLSSLISAAGIKNNAAHRALGDAYALAEFVLATNERRKTQRSNVEG